MKLSPKRGIITTFFVYAASSAFAADAPPPDPAENIGGHEAVASDGTFVPRSARDGRRVSPPFVGRSPIDEPLDGRAEVPARLETEEDLRALLALPAVRPPFAAPETIIGPDDRRRVKPTTAFPARATVLVTFSEGRCTGWLIGRDTVATAGHCVHSGGPDGHWRSAVIVYPGRNGGTRPYGSCTARRLHTVAAWIGSSDDRYDYGAIKLNCDIGETTGWYGMFWQPGSLTGLSTEINGYPGDKPLTQWRSSDRVRGSQALNVFYRNDTVGGMSGSPLWTRRGSSCPVCAMAVHAYGIGLPPFASSNQGTRITKQVFDNLVAWSDAP